MKSLHQALVIAAAALATSNASAQFIKGNEAVRKGPGGVSIVETPPTTGALLSSPCPALRPGCTASGWKMVETPQGLMECTEVYARPTTCKTSTFGTEKKTRLWVVKAKSQWLHCQRPRIDDGCVSIKSLPTAAVQ
jgi:hypothetical protein